MTARFWRHQRPPSKGCLNVPRVTAPQTFGPERSANARTTYLLQYMHTCWPWFGVKFKRREAGFLFVYSPLSSERKRPQSQDEDGHTINPKEAGRLLAYMQAGTHAGTHARQLSHPQEQPLARVSIAVSRTGAPTRHASNGTLCTETYKKEATSVATVV